MFVFVILFFIFIYSIGASFTFKRMDGDVNKDLLFFGTLLWPLTVCVVCGMFVSSIIDKVYYKIVTKLQKKG